MSAEHEQRLGSTPLREIDAWLLSQYTHAAKTDDPDQIAGTLRYFLPRYFELIARDDWPSNIGAECSLSYLASTQFRARWLEREVEAIDTYFRALAQANLFRPLDLPPDGYAHYVVFDLQAVLCLIGCAGGPIQMVLNDWDAREERLPLLHLAVFVCKASEKLLRKSRLGDAFWDGAREAEHAIVVWLMRPALLERLERAVLAETDPAAAAAFSEALSVLETMARRAAENRTP